MTKNISSVSFFIILMLFCKLSFAEYFGYSQLNIFLGEYKKISSLKEIPAPIMEIFNNIERCKGIAESKGEYKPGCMGDKNLPCRKLIRAGQAGEVIFLHYVSGGKGTSQHIFAVRMKGNLISSWKFLNADKVWDISEIESNIPSKPICATELKDLDSEEIALNLCKVQN